MSLRAADPKLGLRVGAVTLLVLALGVVYVLVLRDRLFLGPSVRVDVYFAHVGSLHEGTPVMVAGRQVGKIAAIRLVPRDSVPPDHPLAATGGAVAILRIDEGARGRVPVNGEFFVSSKGLLSERYLEVGAPAGGAAPERPVADGDAVRGNDPPSMDRVLVNMWENLEIARAFLDDVRPQLDALVEAAERLAHTLGVIEPAPGAYAALAERAEQLAAEARTTYLTLRAGGLDLARAEELVARTRQTLADARIVAGLLRGRLAALGEDLDRVRGRVEAAAPGLRLKLRAAVASAETAMARVERLTAKVEDVLGILERGEGTIGRLANDPEFPEDAKALGKILKRTPWRVVGHPQE